MANVWLTVGRNELVENEIRRALDAEALVDPPRPIIRGTQFLFSAKFLYAQQRYAEAAAHAQEGLDLTRKRSRTDPASSPTFESSWRRFLEAGATGPRA